MYTGSGAASHVGIDVSAHQAEIDWSQVAASGVEFAMLRVGYRGYTGGGIYEDAYFRTNIQSALNVGLKVGVYFFSQAISEEEALEEAEAVLEWIEPYNITYPVVFDWETIPGTEARSNTVPAETVTQCVKAFCSRIEEAGYTPMLYSNRTHTYDVIDLEQLSDCEFWFAGYNPSPNFEYQFQMWQYSATGTVPGIATEVDLNLCMVDYPIVKDEGEAEPTETEET